MSLLQRLRLLRRDRGSALLESVVALGVLGFLIVGFAISTVGSQTTQRTAVNHGIAVQAAQGVVEQARSMSWSKVAVKGASATGSALIKEPTGALAAAGIVTVRELPVTLTTEVSWRSGRQHVAGKHPYDTKIIKVTASWDESGVRKEAALHEALLTPSVGEVPPAGIVEVK